MKTKIEQRSVTTTDHDYKDVEFEITIQPMRPLGSKGKSWAAFITRNGMPVAGMGEHYGYTAEEAEKGAVKEMEAQIDARVAEHDPTRLQPR